jgi:CO/xanthine dehydrogenase FAD-binding subunit
MKPARFDYVAPNSLDEALSVLDQHGDRAKLLAGGQSLVPMLSLRIAAAQILIDINRVPGLDYLETRDGGIAIGGMTRLRSVERSPVVAEMVPMLPAALPHVAHFQIRNRGTVGGSIAHGDAAAELPAVLLALDGHVTVRSLRGGARRISAGDLYTGYLTTSLEPDEILTEIWFPALPGNAGWSFHEFAPRNGDRALAGVATTVATRGDHIADSTIALLGLGSTPLRATEAEEGLRGAGVADPIAGKVDDLIDKQVTATSDVHGSAEYRTYLARVLFRRAVVDALRKVSA